MRRELVPAETELAQSASVLAHHFIQRWDRYPKQLNNGRYITVHKPLTVKHLWQHLQGAMTLGTYLLTGHSLGRFLVLDADNEATWQTLQQMAINLTQQNCPSYVEPSRRGGHLWFFLPDLLPARQIRHFGLGLLQTDDIHDVEIFPRQAELRKGPGSLIRLPFGVHRQTGTRYGFHSATGQPLGATIHTQLQTLASPQRVPKRVFQRFAEQVTVSTPSTRFSGTRRPQSGTFEQPLSAQIKAAVTIRDFVGQFVTLSESGQGLCPFHPDTKPSFSVNAGENYWHCFACGLGGSVVDFWMQYQGCDFTTAVRELAQKLL